MIAQLSPETLLDQDRGAVTHLINGVLRNAHLWGIDINRQYASIFYVESI